VAPGRRIHSIVGRKSRRPLRSNAATHWRIRPMSQTVLPKTMEDEEIEQVVTLPGVFTELRGDEVEIPNQGRRLALSVAKHRYEVEIG